MIALPGTQKGAATIQALLGKDHGTLTRVHMMRKSGHTTENRGMENGGHIIIRVHAEKRGGCFTPGMMRATMVTGTLVTKQTSRR